MGKKICYYKDNVDKAWYESSTVFYSECDDKEESLKVVKVVFKNGATYLYKDVKVNDYLMFRESSSQGKALNKFLKHYEYERISNSDINMLTEEYNNLLVQMQNAKNTTYIISAFPGCGKTHTAHQLKDKYNVIDMESSFFPRENFPFNYVESIIDNIGKYDIIFISSHEQVRKLLAERNVDYYLYYPSLDRKTEMLELYKERGNTDSFVELMNNHFETFYDSVNTDPTFNKVCLENEGEFLMSNDSFNNILNHINNEQSRQRIL